MSGATWRYGRRFLGLTAFSLFNFYKERSPQSLAGKLSHAPQPDHPLLQRGGSIPIAPARARLRREKELTAGGHKVEVCSSTTAAATDAELLRAATDGAAAAARHSLRAQLRADRGDGGRLRRRARRRHRPDRRRPAERPGRHPAAARQARRGLRRRLGLAARPQGHGAHAQAAVVVGQLAHLAHLAACSSTTTAARSRPIAATCSQACTSTARCTASSRSTPRGRARASPRCRAPPPARAGTTKYGLGRVPNVFLDLLLVRFLWQLRHQADPRVRQVRPG